jgi:hypothetical protein
MQNIEIQNVIMLLLYVVIIMLNATRLIAIMLNLIMLEVIMLNNLMLNAVMVIVIMLNVMALLNSRVLEGHILDNEPSYLKRFEEKNILKIFSHSRHNDTHSTVFRELNNG